MNSCKRFADYALRSKLLSFSHVTSRGFSGCLSWHQPLGGCGVAETFQCAYRISSFQSTASVRPKAARSVNCVIQTVFFSTTTVTDEGADGLEMVPEDHEKTDNGTRGDVKQDATSPAGPLTNNSNIVAPDEFDSNDRVVGEGKVDNAEEKRGSAQSYSRASAETDLATRMALVRVIREWIEENSPYKKLEKEERVRVKKAFFESLPQWKVEELGTDVDKLNNFFDDRLHSERRKAKRRLRLNRKPRLPVMHPLTEPALEPLRNFVEENTMDERLTKPIILDLYDEVAEQVPKEIRLILESKTIAQKTEWVRKKVAHIRKSRKLEEKPQGN